MAKITIEELSESLKEYLNDLGLTEAQVQELIDKTVEENIGDVNNLETEAKTVVPAINEVKDAIDNKDLSDYQTIEDNDLLTTNKTIVGAVNELFQSANNGKELIANAIGEPLSSEDTFGAMSNDINGLLSTFKTNMMNSGITVNNGDKFKQLIDKIATLADNEGKGIQFASGSVTLDGSRIFQITDLGFTPSFVVYMTENDVGNRNSCLVYTSDYCYEGYRDSDESSNVFEGIFTDPGDGYYHSGIYILKNGFEVREPKTIYEKNLWFAIGVGEEDTTLRDSLADILENKGVDVTEEDDMASLISKVTTLADSKSKDIITASSLPSTVVNGQVVLIPKVETTLPIVLANKSHMKLSTETEICVNTTEIANNFTFNSILSNIKISYYLYNAIQYSGGKNNLIDGYLGVDGVWSQFSRSGIIFYLNGVDGEQISGASSSNNNSVYTGYYINTSNTGGMLNINTNIGSTTSAYVCFRKGYDLTNYSKLEINYVKDSTWDPKFSFGFSKDYNYDNVRLERSVRVDSSSPASGTVSVDVSSLTGVYYFAITGSKSASTRYMLNVSSIILS